MNHIAIDLGSRKSQICVRDEAAKIVHEGPIATREIASWLQKQEPGRLIVETCTESYAIARAAKRSGHEVKVVAASLAKQLGVGERRLKNDQRDARKLSEVSARIELPSVHIASVEAQQIQLVCGLREALVEARTKLVNSAKAYARGQLVELAKGDAETTPRRMREAFLELPTAVERVLVAIETLNVQIKAADKETRAMAKSNKDCVRLQTAPGVGPITSLRFVSRIDDVKRFCKAHDLESYLGLTPSDSSTGLTPGRHGSITKAGDRRLRWTLVQAALSAKRCYPTDPMVSWAQKVAHRRGKHIGTVALARKMAGVLYAMLRDQSDYDAQKMTKQHWDALGQSA
jgi:transposase